MVVLPALKSVGSSRTRRTEQILCQLQVLNWSTLCLLDDLISIHFVLCLYAASSSNYWLYWLHSFYVGNSQKFKKTSPTPLIYLRKYRYGYHTCSFILSFGLWNGALVREPIYRSRIRLWRQWDTFYQHRNRHRCMCCYIYQLFGFL